MMNRGEISAVLVRCPHCGKGVFPAARSCPFCGLIFRKWRALQVRRLEEYISRQIELKDPDRGLIPAGFPLKRLMLTVCAIWFMGGRLLSTEGGPIGSSGVADRVIAESRYGDMILYACADARPRAGRSSVQGVNISNKYLGQASRGVITLNLSAVEESARRIELDSLWWEGNEVRLNSGDARWDAAMQAAFMTFRDLPRERLREEAAKAEFESTMLHECKHVKDRAWDLSPVEAETRAYLAELARSPMDLMRVEDYAAGGVGELEASPHRRAIYRIWMGLLSYSDIAGNPRAVFGLSREEIGRRAKELYESWYGTYEPPDEGCVKALSWARVKDWRTEWRIRR